MTKDQERAELDRTIARFGEHSYLGPWLIDNKPTILKAIELDMPIELMLDVDVMGAFRPFKES